jgi:NAD-dependent DNA ligase
MEVRRAEIMEDSLSKSTWSYWSYTRLLRRYCESLLGICTDIMADGDLNGREIKHLDTWLSDNQSLASTWPVEVMYARIKAILADNKITKDEHEHLKKTLSGLIGNTLQETGSAFEATTGLPIDDIGSMKIKGNIFCFTGNFLYGKRSACELAITERGGTAIPGIRKDLNYLVLGTMASRDWAHTSHGRKIEEAIEFKKDNCPVFIISEKQWVKYL